MSLPPTAAPSATMWRATVMWVALLAMLLVTSVYSLTPTTTLGTMITQIATFGPQAGLERSANDNLIAYSLYFVVTIGIIGLLIHSWLQFAILTDTLVQSYADMEDDASLEIVFTDWLIVDQDVAAETNGGEPDHTEQESDAPPASTSTMVRSILFSIAYAWGLLLAAPAIMMVSMLLFG